MEGYDEFLKTKSRDKSKYTIGAYRSSIDKFLEHLQITNEVQLDKLKINDFLKYQNWLLDSGLGKSSVNTHFRYLASFLNWLKNFDYIKKVSTVNKIAPLEV